MKLLVSLKYHTQWGEQLVFCCGKKRQQLEYAGEDLWTGQINAVQIEKTPSYHYEIEKEGKVLRTEWKEHLFLVGKEVKTLRIIDRWNDIPEDQPLFTSVFTESIFGRKSSHMDISRKGGEKGMVAVRFAAVRPDESLAIVGEGDELGNWVTPVVLDDSQFPIWKGYLPVGSGRAYKYVLVDRESNRIQDWEMGENRFWQESPVKGEMLVRHDAAPQFDTLSWHGAGTAIPVFSLRTEQSFGIGEFNDLKLFVDWAVKTGQRIIQLLPINDTTMTRTWEDSYPYNANSTFALHPQFISLPQAGLKEDAAYLEKKKALNTLPQVDYEQVNDLKLSYLHQIYRKRGKRVSASATYQNWLEENRNWLLPYAMFCCLRDAEGTVQFSRWKRYAKFSQKKLESYVAEHPEEIGFWCFVQYELHVQLSDVCAYAHSKGIVLKGDLPIGISRTSVDAWIHPSLFHMNAQAGAPPDAFAADGQNWGFPTYDWEEMSKDGFAWWKERLDKMSQYFDAFRIDHILGFFRIWEIPAGVQSGLLGHFNPALPYSKEELQARGFDMDNDYFVRFENPGRKAHRNESKEVLFLEDPNKFGYFHPRIAAQNTEVYRNLPDWQKDRFNRLYDDFFYHRHNEFWKQSALKKLPALLSSTKMLACGEDLGMIPASVPEVMKQLRILSLEIQRMPKSVTEIFGNPATCPYHCVCTTSTHDMNPIRAWWKEDRHLTERFWHEYLGEWSGAPEDCTPEICARIVEGHLVSPAMFVILPLQDWLSIDGELRFPDPDKERINIPAIPRHYWRYRMHLTVENLLAQDEFNDRLREMILRSGRE